jgi:hypothetical protein
VRVVLGEESAVVRTKQSKGHAVRARSSGCRTRVAPPPFPCQPRSRMATIYPESGPRSSSFFAHAGRMHTPRWSCPIPFAPTFEDERAAPEPELPPGPPAFHQRPWPTSSSSPGPAPHDAPCRARSNPASLCPRAPCVARARKPILSHPRARRPSRHPAPQPRRPSTPSCSRRPRGDSRVHGAQP